MECRRNTFFLLSSQQHTLLQWCWVSDSWALLLRQVLFGSTVYLFFPPFFSFTWGTTLHKKLLILSNWHMKLSHNWRAEAKLPLFFSWQVFLSLLTSMSTPLLWLQRLHCVPSDQFWCKVNSPQIAALSCPLSLTHSVCNGLNRHEASKSQSCVGAL